MTCRLVVADHLDVVEIALRQVLAAKQHPSVTRDDLRSEGYLALCEIAATGRALDDPRAYAYRAVRKAMARLLRAEATRRERWGAELDGQ